MNDVEAGRKRRKADTNIIRAGDADGDRSWMNEMLSLFASAPLRDDDVSDHSCHRLSDREKRKWG